MKFAIADPPYLGRAALWYGGKGRSKQGTVGRAAGRGDQTPEFHPDAARWDDPQSHLDLIARMVAEFDGWALSASAKTLRLIAAGIPARAHIAVWHVTNAIPDGGRVSHRWEPVIVSIPDERRARGTGWDVHDVLTCAHPVAGFVGSKPEAWTRWVLDMLGYRPHEDTLTDLFAGSGSVSRASEMLI